MDPIVMAVRNLIRYRGGLISMVVEKVGKYSPATSKPDIIRTTYTPRGLVLDAKESISPTSLIRSGDKQIFLMPETDIVKPVANTTEFKIQGDVYKVYLVKELNTNGDKAIYYEVYARR